jgi:peptide/nickel transport system permease protein
VLAVTVLAVLTAAAIAPTIFTAIDPLDTALDAALQPPDAAHPFGTDQLGRDVFSRVVHGASLSIGTGLAASALALLAGTVLGTAAVLTGRVLGTILSRVVDILMAIPEFLIALVMLALLGPGQSSVLIAVAVAATPAWARLVRAQTITVLTAGYIDTARAQGWGPLRIATRHVVPNAIRPLGSLALISIGTAIVTAAGLSFLGLGVQAPTPEWGLMLAEGRNSLGRAWWIVTFPGLAIIALVGAATALSRSLGAQQRGRS